MYPSLRFGISDKRLEAGKRPHGKSPKRLYIHRHCKKLEVLLRQVGKIGEVLHNRDFVAEKNGVHRASSVVSLVNVHGIDSNQRHTRRGQKLSGVQREIGMSLKILLGVPVP